MREEQSMDSLTSGTFVGAGSFSCTRCGYALTLEGSDILTECPGCGGREFVRASLFSTERISPGDEATSNEASLVAPVAPDWDAQLAKAREQIEQPGEYLCFEEGEKLRTVALTREWTRVGRSLAADLRFDDPTVSRRHALIVRQPDGVRLLDDRSLNGVFVNGSRVEGKTLQDGDEIIVGRYRLIFMRIAPEGGSDRALAPDASSLHTIG
jgi:DNA-directed RNA polymerase subunit RPC12/RpoP